MLKQANSSANHFEEFVNRKNVEIGNVNFASNFIVIWRIANEQIHERWAYLEPPPNLELNAEVSDREVDVARSIAHSLAPIAHRSQFRLRLFGIGEYARGDDQADAAEDAR